MMGRNVHFQLVATCSAIHTLLYVERDDRGARDHLLELCRLIRELPADDASIVGAQAQALYHELTGDFEQAIKAREREVELMDSLYADVKKNEYDQATRSALLRGMDEGEYECRKVIISTLRCRVSGRPVQ